MLPWLSTDLTVRFFKLSWQATTEIGNNAHRFLEEPMNLLSWCLELVPTAKHRRVFISGAFAGAKRQVGDKAFIPIMATGRLKLRRVPIRSLCVVQPRSVPAVSLLLSCDWVAKSSARRDKYSICWEAVSLPWSPAEWAMKRPACLLSVSLCVCVCVFSSELCHSLRL